MLFFLRLGLAGLLALLAGTARAQTVAAGGSTSFSIHADGTLWGSGFNANGQLGDGTTAGPAPVQVGTDADWVRVSAGVGFALGICTDGSLWAWGGEQ